MSRMKLLKKRTPASNDLGGVRAAIWGTSTFHRVRPYSIRAGCRSDCQAHLLSQRTADETADAMGLPISSGHEILQTGPFGPFQQLNYLVCFTPRSSGAALARRPAFCRSSFLGGHTGRLWTFGTEALNGFPDTDNGRLAAGE